MASSRRLLVASRSAGKLRELSAMLAEAGYEGVTLDEAGFTWSEAEESIECHEAFDANALAKARYFHRLSGLPTVADDSGLCVDALGGRPGVWSKRYSGRLDLSGQALDDANNSRLLEELAGVTDASARYVCAAAFVDSAREVVSFGDTRGRILPAPRGNGGFGYDPYFLSDDLGMTFGEATIEAKHEVSHRGRAFRALFDALRVRDGGG